MYVHTASKLKALTTKKITNSLLPYLMRTDLENNATTHDRKLTSLEDLRSIYSNAHENKSSSDDSNTYLFSMYQYVIFNLFFKI